MRPGGKSLALLFGLVVLGAVVLAVWLSGAFGAQASMPTTHLTSASVGKVGKQVLKDTANGQTASFVIMLAEQADVSAACNMKDQDARGWYVYSTLRDTAARTQAPIRAILSAQGVPFQSYWAANMIVAIGDISVVQMLSARSDVRSIASNDATNWITDRTNMSVPPTTTSTNTPALPTVTPAGTQPTGTSTRTNTPTVTPIPTACISNLIQNGGFETGSFPPWVILESNPAPTVVGQQGGYSALFGTISGPEPTGNSSIYQTITVPPQGGTLSYWWEGGTTDSITFDWQDAYVTDLSHNLLAIIMHQCQNTTGWVNQTFDMTPFAGQTVDIEFLVHQDGFGDDTYMYVDDVSFPTFCTTPTITTTPPTATPTSTSISFTATPTFIPTVPASGTPTVAATNTTLTPMPTNTSGPPTDTPAPGTVTATPTACVLDFVDVHSTDWFYNYVVWMYCNGIISGYHSPPPCGVAGEGCFKPNNWSTRAQVTKLVVLGFRVPINTSGGPHFQDVPVASTFYNYIETLYNLGAVNGYPCGGPGYPCGPSNLPYFRPDLNVTRGQLTKILVIGAGIPINTTGGPHFVDVPVLSSFYPYAETLAALRAIHGYPCGTAPAGDCVPPDNLPYFMPGNNVTRAQLSQIIYISQPSR